MSIAGVSYESPKVLSPYRLHGGMTPQEEMWHAGQDHEEQGSFENENEILPSGDFHGHHPTFGMSTSC